ncbi:hypothetical protein HPO35_22340 [Klebsiella pneumoniae]|nr:hypothetical protein [Klebsiella pneumoniae]
MSIKNDGHYFCRAGGNRPDGLNEPVTKGFDEGFKQGALEVAREIACRLRDIGWPPERIQEVTGLSGEELKKLFPDEQ